MLWTALEKPSQKMFDLFKENHWKLIECPKRQSCVSPDDQTGPGIHLNMFALAPGKVVVEANEKNLIKTLVTEGRYRLLFFLVFLISFDFFGRN